MVKAVFRFLYKETSTLHNAAYLLGGFALLSQVLAFLRDRLLAHVFGASAALDSYYAAFRIPDFLFVTVASVVSISVLVPFIIERERRGKEEVRKFIDDISSFFSFLIIGVSLLAFFLIPILSPILFKGFSGTELARVILLSRVFLLSPIFLGFSNLLGSLTQAYNRFIVYAFAPLLYNAGIILGILFLAPHFGVLGVALGVVLGSLLHLLIQIPFVFKIGLFPRTKFFFDFQSVKKVALLSFPRTLSLSVNHIATLFLISLASLMPVGSISIYSFALNIQSVPLSVIGVSYSLAAFPTLSRHFADKNIKGFVEQMAKTARHIIFWSLPATVLFIMLRAQIVRVLLGTGRFSWDDTRLTAAALAIFSLSALSQSLLLLFTRAFYSAGHTKKPFFINFISAIVTILFAYSFVKLFDFSPSLRYFVTSILRVHDLDATVLMLPLGYTVGTILNGIVHWIGFEKDFPGFTREVRRTFFDTLIASLLIGVGVYDGLNIFGSLFSNVTLVGIFLQGLTAGIFGIMVGILVLVLLDSQELSEAWHSLRGKIRGTPVIATDPETI
jgi:putative peptidoglycan lipid II flippase